MGGSLITPTVATETQSSLELCRAQILGSIRSESLQDLNDERCRFIPRDALIKVITKEIVKNFLQLYANVDAQELPLAVLVDTVCPLADVCHCGRARCTGSRIIFAALLASSKENLIAPILSESGICDARLYLLSQKKARDQQELPEPFQRLTADEFTRFIHFTWQMRSPFIEGFALEKRNAAEPDTIPEVECNVSLPWIYLSARRNPTQEVVDQPFTLVEKIVIHPAHRDPNKLSGDLCLKTFSGRRLPSLTEEEYKHELQANRRTRRHERIVPLLAAFKHREGFHLILPWAHGGNLGDLFQKYATETRFKQKDQLLATWYSETWLLTECLGLADGLASIHATADTQHASTPAQIHADIKPENILCFASNDGKHGPFTLKLADFGEAQEVYPDTSDVEVHRVTHTKTYRPPEHDIADRVALNYDVWCLGCVFLEYVSWAMGGSNMLAKFEDDRFDEHDDDEVDTSRGKTLTDTFFKKVAESPGPLSIFGVTIGHDTKIRFDTKGSRKATRKQHRCWVESPNSLVKCLVKSGVKSHIKFLQEHCSSPNLERFLDFIGARMLVVDPQNRANSSEVRKFLDDLLHSQ